MEGKPGLASGFPVLAIKDADVVRQMLLQSTRMAKVDPKPAFDTNPGHICWLCGRPLGSRVEWHHPKPKSRGGRQTVAVHPICHRAMHATFDNAALDLMSKEGRHPAGETGMTEFMRWIANKPRDFHAPTRRRKAV